MTTVKPRTISEPRPGSGMNRRETEAEAANSVRDGRRGRLPPSAGADPRLRRRGRSGRSCRRRPRSGDPGWPSGAIRATGAAGARLGSSAGGPRRSSRCRTCPGRCGSSSTPNGLSSAPGRLSRRRARRHRQACSECRDGRRIECVLMVEGPRRTVWPEHPGRLRDGLRSSAPVGSKGSSGTSRRRDRRAGVAPAQPPAAGGDGQPHRRHGDGGEPGEPDNLVTRSIGSARPRRGPLGLASGG